MQCFLIPDLLLQVQGICSLIFVPCLVDHGSEVEIAEHAGETEKVVGHEGDRAVVELETEVVKLFNNFDLVELPSDDI